MTHTRADVAVVGMGAVSAVGTGVDALWAAISRGQDGLRPCRRFPVEEFATRIAGLWPGWDQRAKGFSTLELAVAAAKEAWASAEGDSAGVPPHRVAVLLGTCFGEGFVGFSELTEGVAAALGARGPCLTVSTACASSTGAMAIGRDLIEHGVADLVVAGGADVLTREVFAGFNALGALSSEKCAPFGEAVGTSLGEGAGFVVLEEASHARARGLGPRSSLLGYGLSADAFHDTAPDPSGAGIARAVRAALADAGAAGDLIDCVSAHGTGTLSNDTAEWLGLRSALGASADRTPVSAMKSYLGHAQGAAGVLELIATLACVEHGVVAPTLRSERPRPGGPPHLAAGPSPRPHRTRRVLKVSAAFGGANAALVVGVPVAPQPKVAARTIEVIGLSAIGPHGLQLGELEKAVRSQRPLEGDVPPFEIQRVVRWATPGSVDPSGAYATASAGLALGDAGLQIRGARRERAGLFTGNARMPARSEHECRASLEKRGFCGVAPFHFAHMTLNAPAGTCAKLLSLRGPLLSLSTGRGSGLAALVWAAQHLSTRTDADLLLAGGFDELPIKSPAGHAAGAAFAALTASPAPAGPGVRFAGWGVGGPAELARTIEQAMAGHPEIDGVFAALPDGALQLSGGPADPSRLPLGLCDVGAVALGAESTASAYAFVLAAAKLRRREARRLLVVAAGDSLCCAALLTTQDPS